MNVKVTSIVIMVLVFVCWNTTAQDSTNQSKEIDEIDNFFNNITNGENSKAVHPVVPDIELDKETRYAYNRSMQKFYDYRSSGYEHRKRVFEWQLFSSKIIFYVVIFLVIVGLFFSGVQFYAAYKKNFKNEKVTELNASATGVKISSTVLGVIILIISLLFFYLYLVYVYPITEIF